MTRVFSAAAAAAAIFAAMPVSAQSWTSEPQAPGYAAPNLRLPARNAQGEFVTPNQQLSGHDAFWNLRIALNVAAIGCRGPKSLELVSDYNRIIARHGNLIRESERMVIARLGRETRSNGVGARDRTSTRLFNYFAQPPAQQGFCMAAGPIARRLAEMDSSAAIAATPDLLRKIDAPFVDFYTAYARYQVDLAAFHATRAPTPNGMQLAKADIAPENRDAR